MVNTRKRVRVSRVSPFLLVSATCLRQDYVEHKVRWATQRVGSYPATQMYEAWTYHCLISQSVIVSRKFTVPDRIVHVTKVNHIH